MVMPDSDFRVLVDLDADGALDHDDRAALERRLESSPELRDERRSLARLNRLLADYRIPVQPGFSERVMSSLPDAPWARGWKSWRASVAALAALAAIAMALVMVGAPAAEGSPLVATLGALADFIVAAVLSGAGLLAASWRGVGHAVGDALGVPEQVVFGVGVVALNGFLFLMLRGAHRRRARQTVETERR